MMIGSLPPPSSRAGGRAGMEGKDLGVIETLRREISCLRHTMGERDFSASVEMTKGWGGVSVI